MAGRIKGITIEIGGDTSKLNDALKKTDGQLKKTQTALRDVNKLLKMDPGNTTLLAQKQKDLTQAIDGTKDRLRQLRAAEEQMRGTDMTEKQARQYEALQREIIATEQDLKKLEGQMREFGSVGAQKIAALGEKWETFGGKLKAAGNKISGVGQALLPVTGAITAAAGAAVKTAASFEDGMAGVQATLGITGDATEQLNGQTVNVMDTLSALARQMGEETKFSATEAADGINILAMAGYDTQQIFDGLPRLLNLAAAGDLDIAQAADITTGVLAGFNMETSDSAAVVDKLAKLASSAKGNVSTFGAGLSAVAGQASATGQSFDDVATALGILGNNNIAASEGGTMLQRVLKNLYQPTDAAKKKLVELGVSAYDADGKARALPEVLSDLQAKLGDLDDEARNAVLSKIFDSATIRGANALIREAGDGFDELKGKILDSQDAAQQMADVRMQTLSGQIEILKSQTQEAAISFGQALLPVVKDLVGAVQRAADWINSLSDAEKRAVIKTAAVAAAIGPGMIAIGKTVSAVGSLVEVGGKALKLAPKIAGKLGSLKGGFSGLTAALGGINLSTIAVTGAVGAAAAGFAWLFKHHQDYIRETYGLTEAQKAFSERLEESAEAFRQQEAARQQAIAGVDSEIGHYKALWAELQGMVDADGRIKSGYEDRAKVITGILSDGLGVEIGLTDNVIKNYDALAESMEKTIQKKRMLGYLEANQEFYQDALKGVGQAQSDYYEAIANSAAAAEKLKAAQQQLAAAEKNNSPGNMFANLGNVMHAASAVREAQKAFDDAARDEAKARDEYAKLQTTISNTEALMAAAESGQNLDVAMQNLAVGFKSAGTASKEMLEQQVADFQTKYDNMIAAAESGMVQVSEADLSAMAALLERAKAELAKAGEAGTEAMAQGMQSQTPTVTTAAQGVSDAAAEGAAQNTDAGNTAGQQFDESVAGGVTANAGVVTTAASGVLTTAAGAMVVPIAAAGAAGQGLNTAVAGGMLKSSAVQSAARKLVQTGVSTVAAQNPQAQPQGGRFSLFYGTGITGGQGAVGTAAAGLTAAAVAGLGTGQYQAGYTKGYQYGQGEAAGIRASIPLVTSASAALAAAAPKTTGKVWRTGSPSRVAMELGEYYGEGLAIGMMDELGGVIKASRALAGAVSSGTPAAMQYGPGSAPAAALAAQSAPAVTVTAPTDAAVLRAVQAVLGKMDTLSVGIRNAGQVMDTVTSGVNRRLGRISTLEGSGVI